jgi:hypothetical protein
MVKSSELDSRLKQDSYLDCSKTLDNFSQQELCDAIDANPDCYMGKISDELRLHTFSRSPRKVLIKSLTEYCFAPNCTFCSIEATSQPIPTIAFSSASESARNSRPGGSITHTTASR